MDWVNGLCNCFSPELRKNIIGYLSSSNLNRQVLEQQKCTQQIQQKDEQSIYAHAKARSYYNIDAEDHEQNQSENKGKVDNRLEFENQLEPYWYPQDNMDYDEIFQYKLKALKQIFDKQLDEHYHKVYDSQDENNLLIYVKNQLQKGKKNNIYRFQFTVPDSDNLSRPYDYYQLQTFNSEGKSFVESLLKNRQLLRKTEKGLQICYRTYEKKLVISQHDFITAEKSLLQEELDDELSNENKQVYNSIAYSVCFSVKNVRDQKSVLFQRGNINLCGVKAYHETKQQKHIQNEQQNIKELSKVFKIKGYINVQLDTNVNSNMLKQPVAKQIRIYVQKLISLLQKSDAI